MTKAILVGWQADIDIQTKGLEQRRPTGIVVDVHEIKPGTIYEDANVSCP